jgi:hypothetical protein
MITINILGYKYDTLEDVENAQKSCDVYYGIPKSPNDETKHYVGYSYAELNEPAFWYMRYNDGLLPILGEPNEFEVIFEE